MISQSTIENVRAVEEADADQYRRRRERAEKVEQVNELLLVAGLGTEQREMLAEMVTRVFIAPISDPYSY